MSDRPYSVRDIIVSKLKRLGCDGLASPDADCGCGIADLAPCGGTCMDCLPARSRVTSMGSGWYAVGFVKRPHDAKESNPEVCGPAQVTPIGVKDGAAGSAEPILLGGSPKEQSNA